MTSCRGSWAMVGIASWTRLATSWSTSSTPTTASCAPSPAGGCGPSGCATGPCTSPCCRRDGRLLVHRRSDDKDLWPGRWDLAVGGVVAAGESLRRRRPPRARRGGRRRSGPRARSAPGATRTTTSGSSAAATASSTTGRSVRRRRGGRGRAGSTPPSWRTCCESAPFVPDSVALLPLGADLPFLSAGDTHAG